MIPTIQANNLTLHDLKDKFGLERTKEEQFFPEWQENLPELTDFEKQALEEVKGDYIHLSEYPILEPIVKMVVLSPLLKLAGFYRPPFYLTAEKEVRILSEDEGTLVTGRLDLLVFTPQFWILVIEAKRAQYSVEAGIPQALAYMMGSPESEKPTFGFVTNGPSFIFLKLTKDGTPTYGESEQFSIRNKNDLPTVVKILKRLGQLVSQ
ncbi:MAG: restriction endonuclease subunit R [Microcoleus vaginatus WJT46-NPBG5]|jgi:predicted type IV restriction endonuclease|nr:restriction endonuclease subunit R [Microcoleus vaginatus WJT46-NPBG5]